LSIYLWRIFHLLENIGRILWGHTVRLRVLWVRKERKLAFILKVCRKLYRLRLRRWFCWIRRIKWFRRRTMDLELADIERKKNLQSFKWAISFFRMHFKGYFCQSLSNLFRRNWVYLGKCEEELKLWRSFLDAL